MQKNHLFIGLGGQGGCSLGELRKVMAQRAKDTESLQQQGVRTGFLAIDSSDDVRNQKRTWTDFGIDLALNPSDWLILKRPGAGTIGGLALRLTSPLGSATLSASRGFSASSRSRVRINAGASAGYSAHTTRQLSAVR